MAKGLKTPSRFYDNTMIVSFRDCPRAFYFRHKRNWQSFGKSTALIFGGAWHDAMDTVWKRLGSRPKSKLSDFDITVEAMKTFKATWEEEGGPEAYEHEVQYKKYPSARTTDTAMEMLAHYINERRPWLESADFELLDIERPFAVPLDPADPSLYYVGRLDKVFRLKGKGVYFGEHKTTTLYSKNGPFQDRFTESFSPNSQIDGYLYALRILYGKEAKGGMVDASLVHKDIHDAFRLIPVDRQWAQLDTWLWEARQWIANIEANDAALEVAPADIPYLTAFPKNTSACSHYDGCTYVSLCKMWADPHRRETPQGFEESSWSPFDALQLSQLGFKKAGQ